MNNHYFYNTTLSTFLFILIFTQFSYGQKNTRIPTFEGKIVTDVSKNQLKQNFNRQEVFELPTRELSALVQGKSTTQFELKLGDSHQWKITLFDSNLHAENYITRVMTENGIVAMPQEANAVFKGYLNDDYDHEVRLTIAEGFIFGFVNTGAERYYIEPLKHHDKQANTDHFVLYKSEDIVPNEDAFCGVKDIDKERQEVAEYKQNTLACLEAELAQAADYSMYNKYGSVAALNLYMDGIMNVVATYYDDEFAEQIVILISERYIVACNGCDPWLGTSDYNIIFPDFHSWANSAEGFVTPHDMICLWTNRNIGSGGPSGAVGVVDDIGQVCNPRGSSTIFEDFSDVLFEMQIMATHELGHLFGAFHNYSFGCNVARDPLIMDPFVSPAVGWSTGAEACTLPGGGSVGAINAYVATITCLSSCVGVVCENTVIDSLNITSVSSNSISLTWNAVATNYEVRSRPYNTSAWTYTNATSATNETISGLSCSTPYEVQVRTDCGNGLFGPPRTTLTTTTGLNIDAVNTTNCGNGQYDLELVINTDNAPQGSSFDVIVDGNTSTQTYSGINPQAVLIPGLSADGRSGIIVSAGDTICQQSTTYDAPALECICSPIQVENFDNCSLPEGWTNVSTGDTIARWNFGPFTSGIGTGSGNFDGTCMAFFDDYAYDDNGGERMVLTSPLIDMTDYRNANLEFDYNFFTYHSGSFNVEIFDGTNWVNVLNETTFACGPWNNCTPPHADISIQQYANPDFQVAFTFDDGGDKQWFAAIDNFSICGNLDSCAAINPNFVICHGEELNYDLTQQDLTVNPLGATVTWYDGQPSTGTATMISPATSVDLTSVDLWASVLTANACTKETQITYKLSPDLSITNSIDTICAGATVQLCARASIPATAINWTDESGISIGTESCVNVTPSLTTTYNVAYTDILGCSHTLPTTVHVLTESLAPIVFDANFCESDDFMNYDLTQWDTYLGGDMGSSTIDWYNGQPSVGGIDITPIANATDLTGTPDIWALLTDGTTNCEQEIDLNYQLDYSPAITCPADITVNNDPDTCGAFINIPLATIMDDSLSLLPDVQNIQLDYIAGGTALRFDFSTANIDLTQPAKLSVTAFGDLNLSSEYYDILDENGVSLTLLNGLFCQENVFTYVIPASDINTYAADSTITFTATPTFAVGADCVSNYVEMELSYTSLTESYIAISNDYNNGGADASGYYLPGTTTVIYTSTDGCGNTDTCSIDITVNQEIFEGEDFNFSACGDLMNYDLTQWNTNLGGSMGSSTVWYNGQPSGNGTDISPTANATDLSGMPDLWVLATDNNGCPQEIDVTYQFDFPPVITCPTSITVNNDPDTCGAFINIPLATVADDSITLLADMQNIQLDFLGAGVALQFDFIATDIDLTQSVNLSMTAVGDLNISAEYYDIFDENGLAIQRITGLLCQENVFTYTIPPSDISTFSADSIITFTAIPSSGVDFGQCTDNYVEMQLSYTSSSGGSYIAISNDYNNGGADASGYYLPGTTRVTYTVIDGCGNVETCSIDVTVNQEIFEGEDFNFSVCNNFSNYDLTQWNTFFSGNIDTTLASANVAWYDGQPSANGTDITPSANAIDLNTMPDLWVLVTDKASNCPQEIDVIYQFDFPPVITCPTSITVNNDPDTCGAFINIPLATVADDSIALLPDMQNIQLDFLGAGVALQFDFVTAEIDLTQPVNLSITVVGDLDLSIEYYDIIDENGTPIGQVNGILCQENVFTYTIPTSDINAFAADSTITFTAIPSSEVDFGQCTDNYVEMELSYTSLAESYISISNDYNNGGADASGYYLPGTTRVTYTVIDGCGGTDTCSIDITVNQDTLSGENFNFSACNNFSNYDLTQWDAFFGANTDPNLATANVNWYNGQPSTNGTDITPTANDIDLNTIPDLWVLVTDNATGCIQEIDVTYQFDFPPVITCPASMTVNNDPDTCGAFVNIPLATIMDDSITLLPAVQTIRLDYIATVVPLQFDFTTANIDLTQPVNLSVTAFGDLNLSSEYYDIFDENGLAIERLNGFLCQENIFAYTIPTSDIDTFSADGTITFIATPSFSVGADCASNYVEMELSYTSLAESYIVINNNYNEGGADASGYYLPGTTTVTYTVIDGCGNTDTCSIDITVNQEIFQVEDFNFSACGDLENYDLTQWDVNFGGNIDTTLATANVAWYFGQPSADGMDITSVANAIDLINTTPDLWVLVTDKATNCPTEIDITYQFDFPPVITCPANITVSNDPDTCGAFINIPLATVADDSITLLPDMQNIRLDYIGTGVPLQFDFIAANIDLTQPVNLNVIAYGDLNFSSEYYDITDENGTSLTLLNGSLCQENVFTYVIPTNDFNAYAADSTVTFTATPSFSVGADCSSNYVEIELSYTSLTESYIAISNDYNNGGADASGYYLPGTTTVRYTVTDGCGNVEVCSVDVTVNQEIFQAEDFNFSACGNLENYDLTQWDVNFSGNIDTTLATANVAWYFGQPSTDGADITSVANDIDLLNTTPDLWVLVTDKATNCPTEIDITYQFDFPPVITCPANITVSNDPDTCGAFINIPLVTVTDDSITPLPIIQNIQLDAPQGQVSLLFDFVIESIDLSQPVNLSVTTVGDVDNIGEYYSLSDENGVFITTLRGILCQENVFNYTIPPSDISAFAADNIITFRALRTAAVNPNFCTDNYVAMELSYTSSTSGVYTTISNDYNEGGADASGFYLPGTTTITYTVIDGCGNVETCNIDVTVDQEITRGEDVDVIACGDLTAYDLTEWNIFIPADSISNDMISWYDGQPSADGIDISATANATDLTAMPDLWALISDGATACLEEIKVNYTLDTAPQLVCPPAVEVDADSSICGAEVMLEALIVIDDSLFTLPDTQTILDNQAFTGDTLQFDFDATNIDTLQDLTLDIISTGDLGFSSENYSLYDENNNLIGTIGNGIGGDCTLKTDLFTIPANDLGTLTADGVMTFIAIPTSGVSPSFCSANTVEITLSYTSLVARYFTVSNDFNNGGADASGFYPSGTTTVTYTVTDGCGNVSTCNTDVTVNQAITEGIFDIVTDADVVCTGGSTELCLDLGNENHNGTVAWTDDMGNLIDTTLCVIVTPATDTTSYTAVYTFPNSCIDVSQITITNVGSTPLESTILDLNICIPENVTSYDLTQYNTAVAGDNGSVNWYIGQPSMGGTDITPLAANVNLNTISDVWILVTNNLTNCTQEINFIFEIDRAPVITCPAAITVNNDTDTCGAFVNIPLATVTDDNLIAIADQQTIRQDYIAPGTALQFDFPTTNIDLTQSIDINIKLEGYLGVFNYYYDIFDENNNLLLTNLGNSFCVPELFTYTISVSDLNAYAADSIITFTATPTTSTPSFCNENYAEIELSYTNINPIYTAISNDYNDNGADASGFYLPGTTTVTYTAVDGCGNTDTCSVDITVNQAIAQGEDIDIGVCGDLINYDLMQWNTYFGGAMGSPTITWYDGQPSVNGDDITPTSDSIDLTAMPDIWALLADTIGCTQEVNLNYQIDFPPVITCPLAITVDAAPGGCGADIIIPPIAVADDSISLFPGEQSVFVNYISSFQNLQFDFDGANIDISQPATLTITVYGDLGLISEYYDIYDENINFLARLGNDNSADCEPETSTFTISSNDLAGFLADNIITFIADPSSSVDAFCNTNGVAMTLSYTPRELQYVSIINDYNNNGSDASGYYPSGTTLVTYLATDGCGNTDTCTLEVTVNQTPLADSTFTADYCGDITAIDLTIYDEVLQTDTSDLVRWFIGQPSAGGTDITATANSTDLSAMPDLWVEILQDSSGCNIERDIVYQLDTSPVFTSCPADIVVDAIPGVCGAFVTLPFPVVEDDSITALPPGQAMVRNYTLNGQSLQFDFDGTLIDSSQPLTLTVNAIAELGSSFEYFDILDENGNPIGRVGNNFFSDCVLETTTITIAPADLAAFLTDNVITFVADPSSGVSPFFCINPQVEMILSYTSLGGIQYFNIENDFNVFGADASGLYPSGTTLVTYVATDACGNTDTCQVNVTVNQDPLMGMLTAVSDAICRNDSTTICIDEPLAAQIIWTDDMGNTLPQTDICINVAPDTTTTYTANYLPADGCSYTAMTTVQVYELIANDPMLSFCQDEDISNIDLTLYDESVSPIDSVDWYDGNPTDGGAFIYPPTAVDLNMIDDLWALVTSDIGCTDVVNVSVSLDQGVAPVGAAVCFPIDTADLAEIVVVIPENYPTPENLMYRLDDGVFQNGNRFMVNNLSFHNVTIMDITTACSYDVEVNCFLLPVELTFLSVHCIDNQYVLNWETATESEVLDFVVERSTDGVNFSNLGQVTAAGNSDVPQSYQFTDETVQTGRYYYRLRIVEADGTATYSPVEVAECLGAKFDAFDIFPNPTDAQLNIIFESNDNKIMNFKLTDVLGRIIIDENITPQVGLNNKIIDMTDLSSAVYFVIVNDGMVVKKVLRK